MTNNIDKNVNEKKIKKIKEEKPKSSENVDTENYENLQVYCEDVDGKFLHVKVGNDNYPAKQNELEEIEEKFNEIINKNKLNTMVLVTHHAVTIDFIR